MLDPGMVGPNVWISVACVSAAFGEMVSASPVGPAGEMQDTSVPRSRACDSRLSIPHFLASFEGILDIFDSPRCLDQMPGASPYGMQAVVNARLDIKNNHFISQIGKDLAFGGRYCRVYRDGGLRCQIMHLLSLRDRRIGGCQQGHIQVLPDLSRITGRISVFDPYRVPVIKPGTTETIQITTICVHHPDLGVAGSIGPEDDP